MDQPFVTYYRQFAAICMHRRRLYAVAP